VGFDFRPRMRLSKKQREKEGEGGMRMEMACLGKGIRKLKIERLIELK